MVVEELARRPTSSSPSRLLRSTTSVRAASDDGERATLIATDPRALFTAEVAEEANASRATASASPSIRPAPLLRSGDRREPVPRRRLRRGRRAAGARRRKTASPRPAGRGSSPRVAEPWSDDPPVAGPKTTSRASALAQPAWPGDDGADPRLNAGRRSSRRVAPAPTPSCASAESGAPRRRRLPAWRRVAAAGGRRRRSSGAIAPGGSSRPSEVAPARSSWERPSRRAGRAPLSSVVCDSRRGDEPRYVGPTGGELEDCERAITAPTSASVATIGALLRGRGPAGSEQELQARAARERHGREPGDRSRAGFDPAHLALDPAEPHIEALPTRRDQIDQDGEIVDRARAFGVRLAPEVADGLGELAEHRAEPTSAASEPVAAPVGRDGCCRRPGSGRCPSHMRRRSAARRHAARRARTANGCVCRGEVVEHGEHALLDRLADWLACEHADDALDGDVCLLGDLDQNRHTAESTKMNAEPATPRPAGFCHGPRFQIGSTSNADPWTRSPASA